MMKDNCGESIRWNTRLVGFTYNIWRVGEFDGRMDAYVLLVLFGFIASCCSMVLASGGRAYCERQPSCMQIGVSDCELTSSAVFNDSMITFRNVRDFHWRTTHRDENGR